MQRACEKAGRICKGKGLGKELLSVAEHGGNRGKRKAQKVLNRKKCQGSQRIKTTNIRREFIDEKIGREEVIFPSLLPGYTSPLRLMSFILSHMLPSILTSPL